MTANNAPERSGLQALRALIGDAGKVVIVLALIAAAIVGGAYAFSWLKVWVHSLSSVQLLLAVCGVVTALGFIYALTEHTKLATTAGVWLLLASCGWVLGYAIDGVLTGVAGATLVGFTAAANTAAAVYDAMSRSRELS